ncbi:hypothetical protein TBLA_0F01590 [Henningerozyma blattae CBS 6284]|uniref:Holocytochrome c-type synthase n=1 Tax=Henningerozyma blattae (strain ATCC 34711 / CBS 6284 / DSM 70876 / NBRC 10599 / NRRL Y-10934 / UCD 77-7) TaxID=1071380 RepID=I2H5P9_HENB6|nr:hypothetical protein TBLA_0F01590 [Tetrapisispora blattae CBS 6284]CCH61701.1 hypothetical protein TBLA_0F01590 [Tetrapisispora blattae CBS 6284]
MGLFWATPTNTDSNSNSSTTKTSGSKLELESNCPYLKGKNSSKDNANVSTTPFENILQRQNNSISNEANNQDSLDPLNHLPKDLSLSELPGQSIDLPKERSISSIPKGNTNTLWEYPSPQQMYNAMVRKGKIDVSTGEEIEKETVISMVDVHNFLNEGCWDEILKWEKPYTEKSNYKPTLLKFIGKPDQYSPRAKAIHYLSMILPNHFSNELPFDRHDWFVLRKTDPNTPIDQGTTTNASVDGVTPGFKVIRYVIDFYGGPDDKNGMPTFNLDVRPALDSLTNVCDRFNHQYQRFNQKRSIDPKKS